MTEGRTEDGQRVKGSLLFFVIFEKWEPHVADISNQFTLATNFEDLISLLLYLDHSVLVCSASLL